MWVLLSCHLLLQPIEVCSKRQGVLVVSVFWLNASRDHPTSHAIDHYTFPHLGCEHMCYRFIFYCHLTKWRATMNLKERRSSKLLNALDFCWGQQHGKRWLCYTKPKPTPKLNFHPEEVQDKLGYYPSFPRPSWLSHWFMKGKTIPLSHIHGHQSVFKKHSKFFYVSILYWLSTTQG